MVHNRDDLNVGDFVAGYLCKDRFVVGVITSEEFDFGFYDLLRQEPHTNSNFNFFDVTDEEINKISKKKALQFLQEGWDRFEREIKAGGLTGALASRKQYSLDQVVSCIKRAKDPTIVENKVIETPRTGVYVLEGNYEYSGDGDERFLDGLVIKPRQNQEMVKEFIKLFYKGGTENIPPKYDGHDLHDYEVTEIPEKGIKLVKPRLVINISEKRVS